ncbi:MAG: hypothetical protein COW01_05740 [Bdellovibrionales bacterium CG12_big_fil_rev_8_21_14_0_65_38_15]|nr:MAG: hypothetical protein COW79_03635 [Bdellovibrionales bacterium CG22_combo_CG10-13_8_21_14_all_38_13]PIQ55933.1 MAG: hypothetical protein COW01_05740 [Bdellovibrionales bacterium CG12_big_fil_rev_8_21_14_0_65_38_15]PIR29589.1 MAG: hypothetical protein COV38_10020 [Bdellovibrionales bacterium CG11_big_fil_rev_8_21_14_0_20_38_13]
MSTKDNEKSYNVVRSEPVVKAYAERLKVLKKAQEFAAMEEIPKAVQFYSQYLNILAQYFDVPESSLSPAFFNRENDLAEMLLISHVYWDLGKAYDRSPNLTLESIRCLKQFVAFTIGFKYQYANSQMVKKFVRQKLAHNPKAFKDTYEKIRIEAKGCYIATLCYGSLDPRTIALRDYRDTVLSRYNLGKVFIHIYQVISPIFVRVLITFPFLNRFFEPLLSRSIGLYMKISRISLPQ